VSSGQSEPVIPAQSEPPWGYDLRLILWFVFLVIWLIDAEI